MAKKEDKITYKFGDVSIDHNEVEYWIKELKLGRSFRKKYFFDDTSEKGSGPAKNAMNYFDGEQAILSEGLETPIVDNQIAPITNSFVSAIIHSNPDIIVKMKRQPTIPYQKEIASSVFRYFSEELKQEWHNHQVVFDAYLTGLGVKNIGYNSEFDSYEYKETVKSIKKKRKGKGRGKGSKTVEEEVEEELTRRREWITKEFPFSLRHSPLLTIVDPRSKSAMPYDGKWIALEYEVPYNEVQGNEAFKNKKELSPTGAVGTTKEADWEEYQEGMCHLYQIQIAKKDGLYLLTLARDYDKPLDYKKYPFVVEGFLTTFLTLNETIDTFYPVPDTTKLIPLQDEINYIQSRNLEAIYKFLPKIGLNMDFFKSEEEALNVVEKGNLGSVLINKGQASPQQAAQVLNFNLDLRDKLSILQDLRNEMRLISGVTEAELTGRTSAETATEANIGQRGSVSRIVSKREKVRRFLKEDLRKFKQLVMQSCDWPLITKITGIKEQDPMTGEPVTERWLRLNSVKDALVGEYDLDVDMISGQQPNPELTKRQILESANFLFSPMVEQALAREGMKVDKAKLIKEFLRNMDQFREAEDLIVSLSPEEKQALLQQQMLESGGPSQMATSPQGMQSPPTANGDPTTMGQMISQTLGTI